MKMKLSYLCIGPWTASKFPISNPSQATDDILGHALLLITACLGSSILLLPISSEIIIPESRAWGGGWRCVAHDDDTVRGKRLEMDFWEAVGRWMAEENRCKWILNKRRFLPSSQSIANAKRTCLLCPLGGGGGGRGVCIIQEMRL